MSFTDPLASYTPTIAPASAAFHDGAFYFGTLAGEHLYRIAFGFDGLYFVTSNQDGQGTPTNDDDRILRSTP